MSPYSKAVRWWKQLSRPRRITFVAGLAAYFGSYEYIHDFGVKRPLLAAVGVLMMIATDVVRPAEAAPSTAPATEDAAAATGSEGPSSAAASRR